MVDQRLARFVLGLHLDHFTGHDHMIPAGDHLGQLADHAGQAALDDRDAKALAPPDRSPLLLLRRLGGKHLRRRPLRLAEHRDTEAAGFPDRFQGAGSEI